MDKIREPRVIRGLLAVRLVQNVLVVDGLPAFFFQVPIKCSQKTLQERRHSGIVRRERFPAHPAVFDKQAIDPQRRFVAARAAQ